VVSRQGVKHIPVLQLVALRQTLAGIILVSFFILKRAPWPRKGQWLHIFILSALNLIITNGLTTLGVKYIPAGLASIIAVIFPLWLIIIGAITKTAETNPKAWLGLLLGFGGVCIIFYEHLKDLLNVDFRFGILISLLASLSWALGSLYTKKQSAGFDPYFSIDLQMLIAGIFLFPFLLATGQALPLASISLQTWLDILFLAVFGSVVSFVAYLYALQRLPAEHVSIYAYLNPVVAVLFSAWLFDEKMTLFIGIGGIIALYGVYLVNRTFNHISQ
jgi:drug/metabolite transporter (DMT)-like permease